MKKRKTLVEVFTEEAETPGTEAWFGMINERYGDMLTMDGYDDCIMGVTTQFNKATILYDKEKVIAKLAFEMVPKGVARNKAVREQAEEDAIEYFNFNMIGAWMGEGTPSFFTRG
jgi:hypothetical protein